MKYIHMAEMTGLSPHQNYTYKITCNNEMSREWSFQTQPSAQDRPIKVIFYGDMGYGSSSEKTLDVLEKDVTSEYYDAIFHIGDYAYDLESDGGWMGDAFMELIQPIAARVPYMTSPGNHELGHDFHHYRTRFSMPGADWPMPMDRLWYSYNIGIVHFIVYSTEVYFISNSDYMCIQFYWLLDDLTKANQNRDKQPWIVAMAHRPMYCSNNSTDDCMGWILGNKVKHGLEDLFYAQGVDLILQAHEHSYERLWPLYKDEVVAKDYNNPTVPIHIISGAAGSSEGANSMGEGKIWSAFRDKGIDSSFGRLQVFNASHLYFEQVIVKDGRTLDSIWLVQSHHGPNVANLNCSSEHAHLSCKCPVLFPVLAMLILGGVLFFLYLCPRVYIVFVCGRRTRDLSVSDVVVVGKDCVMYVFITWMRMVIGLSKQLPIYHRSLTFCHEYIYTGIIT